MVRKVKRDLGFPSPMSQRRQPSPMVSVETAGSAFTLCDIKEDPVESCNS
jgi:hypothetical protein